MEFTESVRSFQVPDTPCTSAWPPRRPSVPTSRATRVTSEANEPSWSTMVLITSLICRISPFTSTVIFFPRSPFASTESLRSRSPRATAFTTSAMPRTCPVRFSSDERRVGEGCSQRRAPPAPGRI